MDHPNQQTETPPQGCMPCRPSGRLIIKDIQHRLNRRSEYLETLSNMLPAVLTPEQDEALWHIVLQLERTY